MHQPSFIHCALVYAVLTLLSATLVSSARAANDASNTPVPRMATAPGSALAAGSREDSLQACLVRIPKDATIGQRLIAEQSCQRDEVERKPSQTFSDR